MQRHFRFPLSILALTATQQQQQQQEQRGGRSEQRQPRLARKQNQTTFTQAHLETHIHTLTGTLNRGADFACQVCNYGTLSIPNE